MSSLKGKVAIVTGAGGGIGLGIAKAFAKEGVSVVITDLASSDLGAAQSQLEAVAPGVRVLGLVADGKDHETANTVVARTVESFGRLDILVNNAQQFRAGTPLEGITWEDMIVTYESGVFATWRYMKAAFAHLKKSSGTVINLGSGAGTMAVPNHAAYGSNKEAIRGLSRIAAREWAQFGITVNTICPLAHSAESERLKREQPELIAQFLKSVPLGRYGDPEVNVGGLCVFLARPEGRYMTGSNLDMDGGGTIRP